LEEDLLEKPKPRYSKRTKKQFKKSDLLYVKDVKDYLDAEEKARIDKLYKVNVGEIAISVTVLQTRTLISMASRSGHLPLSLPLLMFNILGRQLPRKNNIWFELFMS
jgi:hypothetical protein